MKGYLLLQKVQGRYSLLSELQPQQQMRSAGNKNLIILFCLHIRSADVMNDEEGNVVTAHSTNKVPFIIIGAGDITLEKEGRISDICPTMLDLMGISKPSSMTGRSLQIK